MVRPVRRLIHACVPGKIGANGTTVVAGRLRPVPLFADPARAAPTGPSAGQLPDQQPSVRAVHHRSRYTVPVTASTRWTEAGGGTAAVMVKPARQRSTQAPRTLYRSTPRAA